MGKIKVEIWETKFAIAEAYYQEFGNLLVPDKFMYKGINLGNWIYLQRVNYREGNFTDKQIQQLESIGMVWDVIEAQWEKKYEIAKRFYESNKSLLIPIKQKYEGESIGSWIGHQREKYAKGLMEEEKIKKLEAIGMVWDASQSNLASSFPEQAFFFYLKQVYPDSINRHIYDKSEIDIYIPSLCTGIEYDGYAWHQNIKKDIEKSRKLARNGIRLIRIREDGCPVFPKEDNMVIFDIKRGYPDLHDVIRKVIIFLDGDCKVDIDLIRDQLEITANYINIYNSRWEEMYLKAKALYENSEDLTLAEHQEVKTWLRSQRQRYKHKGVALTADQIKKLNKIGMVWEPYKEVWEKMYLLASEYYKEYGDLNVATTATYRNESLGSWISTQRNNKVSKKLSKDKIKRLNEIGMIWDAKPDYDQMWLDMFYKAKEYYEKYGDLRISTKAGSLGGWINNQRDNYVKGALEQNRISLLNSIGMIWDIYEADWDDMYNLACEYYSEHGNLDIKAYEQYKNKNLGAWVKRQCSGKESLSPEKIKRLELLNIVWKRNPSKWDNMFNLAKEYYEEHGNLLVNTHSLYKGEKLGHWINHQRSFYFKKDDDKRNEEFTEDRIRALEEIGMIWDVNQYKWNKMYSLAEKYYLIYGHINVSGSEQFEGENLGKWLQNQRSAYRGYKGRKPLEEYQIKKLDDIKMQW